MEHLFVIENLKCGGCTARIRQHLSGLSGVQSVTIDSDRAEVTVETDGLCARETVSAALKSIGYPEVGENTLRDTVVSFVSCAIGRMSGEAQG